MNVITIQLSDSAVAKLQPYMSRTILALGKPLTLEEWVQLHLQELAIQEELAAATQEVQRTLQASVNLTAEVQSAAARQKLLDAVAVDDTPAPAVP
jgi:hypothetical protein